MEDGKMLGRLGCEDGEGRMGEGRGGGGKADGRPDGIFSTPLI